MCGIPQRYQYAEKAYQILLDEQQRRYEDGDPVTFRQLVDRAVVAWHYAERLARSVTDAPLAIGSAALIADIELRETYDDEGEADPIDSLVEGYFALSNADKDRFEKEIQS